MKKGNLLLRCLFATLFFPVYGALAQQHAYVQGKTNTNAPREMKPIEAFIARMHETNKFVEVNNIWQPDNNYDKTTLLEKVEKVQPLNIDYAAVADLIQKNNTAISLVIPDMNGGTYTLELGQYSSLSNDFMVHSMAGDVETNVEYTRGKYYSGIVKGIPGSIAAFSFFKNEVYALFSIPDVGNFVLVPNSMAGNSYDYNQRYILYNDQDLKIKSNGSKCATDQLNTDYLNYDGPAYKTTTTLNNNVYNNCKQIRVMEVADYALYQTRGSNTTNVTNYMTALFNNQATIYRNEGVLIVLKYLQVNTASDAYQSITGSSSQLFLHKFGYVTQNTYSTTYGCDLAMLASTRLNGGYGALGGVAWLMALCKNYRTSDSGGSYGYANMDNSGTVSNFPLFSWAVEVLAHEMGHMVGSPHTHACCWNPPARNTAIDGCYALEGSCAMPSPQYPAAKGTVMSYCHISPAPGINLANGFGPQPGDTIRRYIANASTCGAQYTPTVALPIANRTISANRECTNLTNNTTYYWYDNNTADQNDDTLVLMLKKNGNNIGNLNTTGFSVTANTTPNYGSGTGALLNFPGGMPSTILAQSYGMRRYWTITPTTAPTTNVEVIYPFTTTDTSDVHGSVGSTPVTISDYLMYMVNPPINPNPEAGFAGSTASNFQIYTYGAAASTSNWSISTVGNVKLAHMLTTSLSGGGTGFFTYCVPHPAPTLDPLPAAPCPNDVVTYSVEADPTAASFEWSVTGTGWSGTSTTNTITLTAGTAPAVITVKAVDSCGPGNGTTFTVTPAPKPTVTITTTSSLCVGTPSLTLNASATASPTSYSWTVNPAGGWSGSSSTSSIDVIAGTGTGTVTATATNVCGTGPATTFLVSMTATPPPAPTSITPPALICPSSNGTFTTPPVAGATSYAWTVSGTGWSGSGSSTSINVGIGTGIGTLTVHAINGCGIGPDYTRNFSTSTGPGASTSITAPTAPCSGTTVSLSTPVVPSASAYTWNVSGSGWSGGTGSTSNTINVTVGTGTATVTVTPSNACGAGGSYTTYITPTPAPTSTFALSSHVTAVNSDIYAYYTGTAAAGSVFTWSFPGGIGAPGTGAVPQTVHWNAPGQYLIFLNVSNGAGCSSATADTVNVISGTGLPGANVDKIEAGIVPNPSDGAFDIMFTNPVNEQVSIKLFDVQGRMVYTNSYTNASEKKIAVKAGNLAPGTYTVTISVNDNTVSKKVTIIK